MARLKEMYQNEMVDALMKKFGYKNVMQVPKLEKIVVNMGVGEAKENAKILDNVVRDLAQITRRLSPPRRKSPLQTLSLEKEWQSDVKLPCGEKKCTSLQIA